MVSTLASQIKEYKLASILTPIFMILEVVAETLIPLLMSRMVDYGVNAGNMDYIVNIAIQMLIIAAFGLLSGYMGGRLGAYASTGFAHNLRDAMFANIQEFSFDNIDKFSTSSLVTRLTTDVNNLQQAYQMILRMTFRAPASLIVSMIMAFKISPELASVYLYAAIFLAIVLLFIMSKASRHFQAVFKKYDDLNRSVQENVSSIRVVKAYVREDYEKERFKEASSNIYNLFLLAEKTTAWIQPIMQATVYACILLISWLGANMIVNSQLSTGNLMSLLTYCMQILMSLMMLGMVFVMITMSLASAKRVAEVINEESNLKDPENPIKDIKDGSIDFDHVSFHYYGADEDVLDDISFHIESGETIGLIGATGSGKSTLVSLISRLYDVSEGSVKVAGEDVRKYDIEALRNEVAMVLQKNELFSGTIYDNLRWGDLNATDEECQKACEIAQASEFIARFKDGYNTHIEQGGNNVSGGQKQRLCIARALLKKPKVLILDDSTSAVDTATDAKMRKAFREDLSDMTKIIIAQRISSVQDAYKILVLEDGKITGFANHDELMKTNEFYSSLYLSQLNGSGDFDEGGEMDA